LRRIGGSIVVRISAITSTPNSLACASSTSKVRRIASATPRASTAPSASEAVVIALTASPSDSRRAPTR
jgi:hypothetical protein